MTFEGLGVDGRVREGFVRFFKKPLEPIASVCLYSAPPDPGGPAEW
jgi:hypothetical protein